MKKRQTVFLMNEVLAGKIRRSQQRSKNNREEGMGFLEMKSSISEIPSTRILCKCVYYYYYM